MTVQMEVLVIGMENGLHIASIGDAVVKADLITADCIDINNEDVNGKVSLEGFWDEDVFVAETIKYLH